MEANYDIVRLVCVGSPLLDISAPCKEDFLEAFGLKPDDSARAESKHDDLFRILFRSSESRITAGGSAQNTARISKWTLGTKGEVAFIGCAGCDDFEASMRSKLISEGVLPLYVRIPDEPTGVCACLLTADGRRSMVARHGAANSLSSRHLYSEDIQRRLEEAHCIFAVGYLLANSPGLVKVLSERCSLSQKVFSLSLSSTYICRDYLHDLLEILPRVDVLFGNEAEVLAFAGAMGGEHEIAVEDAIRTIRQIQKQESTRPRILVVTRGANPVLVDNGSVDLHVYEIPKTDHVVDSVGCGDAFAGAFLANYILTHDVDSSATVGIQAAMKILQVHGCNPPT